MTLKQNNLENHTYTGSNVFPKQNYFWDSFTRVMNLYCSYFGFWAHPGQASQPARLVLALLTSPVRLVGSRPPATNIGFGEKSQ